MPRTVVGVMGPGAGATAADRTAAEALGRAIAEAGWVLLTGGRPAGVMAAASRGAQAAGGWVVGLLPGDDPAAASEWTDLAIATGLGNARNAVNVLSCAVVVACGMGAGTASEVALALKAGRPVVLLGGTPESRAFFQQLGGDRCVLADSVPATIAAVRAALADLR